MQWRVDTSEMRTYTQLVGVTSESNGSSVVRLKKCNWVPFTQMIGYGLGDQGSIRFWAEEGNFLFATTSRPVLGSTQPPNQWVPGGGDLSPGVKRPEREANHSPSSSAEVKNTWRYTSTPPYVMLWCLVKHRDNFTFYCDTVLHPSIHI